MNRKDTIIVAVIINAGLLVMLFVSALRHEPQPEIARMEKPKPVEIPHAQKKETPLAKSTPDQVDQILAQYSKKIVKETSQETSKEPLKEEKKVAATAKVEAPAKEETVKQTASPKQVQEVQVAKKIGKEKENKKHEELIKVVVKKGDVLEKIAKTYGTTVGALMQENQLTDSRLQIGQVLSIPKEKESATFLSTPVVSLEEKFYIVKNGDNLWKIAIENKMKVEELLKLNQLTEKQAKALRPGDRLRIQ